MIRAVVIALLGVCLLFFIVGCTPSLTSAGTASSGSSLVLERCLKFDQDFKKIMAVRAAVVARRVEMAMIEMGMPEQMITALLRRSTTSEYTPAIMQQFESVLGSTIDDLYRAAGCDKPS